MAQKDAKTVDEKIAKVDLSYTRILKMVREMTKKAGVRAVKGGAGANMSASGQDQSTGGKMDASSSDLSGKDEMGD